MLLYLRYRGSSSDEWAEVDLHYHKHNLCCCHLQRKERRKRRPARNKEDKKEQGEKKREQRKMSWLQWHSSGVRHLLFLLQPDGITLPWCHQAIASLSPGNYLSSTVLWLAHSQHCHTWPLKAQQVTYASKGPRASTWGRCGKTKANSNAPHTTSYLHAIRLFASKERFYVFSACVWLCAAQLSPACLCAGHFQHSERMQSSVWMRVPPTGGDVS